MSEQLAIAGLRHPARAGEMAVMHLSGAHGLSIGVDPEDQFNYLFPIGFFGLGIKEAPIGVMMRFVIGRDGIAAGRCVEKFEVRHDAGLSFRLMRRDHYSMIRNRNGAISLTGTYANMAIAGAYVRDKLDYPIRFAGTSFLVEAPDPA